MSMPKVMEVKLYTSLNDSQKASVFNRWSRGIWDGNLAGANHDFREVVEPSRKIFCAMHADKCYGVFWCREFWSKEGKGRLLGEVVTVFNSKQLFLQGVDVGAELMKGVNRYAKRKALTFSPLLPTPAYNRMIDRIAQRSAKKLSSRKSAFRTLNIRKK